MPLTCSSLHALMGRPRLRLRLGRPVELRFRRGVALDDDRAREAAALVVAGAGAVPVLARTVEAKSGRPLGVIHHPDELRVAIARQHRAVGVLVIVDECELHLARVRQDEHPWVIDELVLQDADGGRHLAVGPLLGAPDPSPPQDATKCRPILAVQTRHRLGTCLGNLAHGAPPPVCGYLCEDPNTGGACGRRRTAPAGALMSSL